MKRKVINSMWENEEAQKAYADWRGFPGKEETALEVDKMSELLGLQNNLNILDIPCGSGRHSLEFAKRSNYVTGVDIASTYIEEAREQAIYGDLKIDFRLQREFHIRDKEKYDFILAFNHTLGFIKDGQVDTHLNEIKRALKEGGKFLLKISEEVSEEKLTEKKIRAWGEKNNKYILNERYLEGDCRIEKCIFIDPKRDEIIEYVDKKKHFTHDEIVDLLKKSGFRNIKCYADLNGTSADNDSHGIYVCEK